MILTFKDDFNAFLKDYILYICLGLVALILIVVFLTVFLPMILKKKTKKVVDYSEWLNALGTKDNILSISAKGSRLTIEAKNKEKIDETLLKNLGVSNIIKMSNKIILVIENKAQQVADEIQKIL